MRFNRWPPALIRYTDKLPVGTGGETIGPVVFIRPKYEGDQGLLRHELEHVKQGWLGLFVIHALLYLFYRPYRLWAEVSAYKVQCEFPRMDGTVLTRAAAAQMLLMDRYKFGLTLEQAQRLLE